MGILYLLSITFISARDNRLIYLGESMKAIIITGDLATGKSTFANIISKRFNVLLLTKDHIKEVLSDRIGFTNREENLKLSKASMHIMFYALENANNSNTNIILEANFHQEEIDYLKKYKDDVLVLNLYGNEEILFKRFINRIENENRHKVHLSIGLNDLSSFSSYIKKSRDVDFKGLEVISIDATNFSYQNDEDLFTKISNFLNR